MQGVKPTAGDDEMKTVCRFKFPEGVDKGLVEAKLALAIIAAEYEFGQPKVRISAAYWIRPEGAVKNGGKEHLRAVVDVSTEVGERIATVLTGLLIDQLGEEGFAVDRIDREDVKEEEESNE
jgi:hypothetical protein